MGWRILVFYPEPEASMNYFDSDMSKNTNTVVYFDWKTVIQEKTVLYLNISPHQLEIWWLQIEFTGDASAEPVNGYLRP